MYFIEIPFQGWGDFGVFTPSTDSPASLYNPSCALFLKDDKLFMDDGEGRDNIVYFFILRNLFEHPPAILQLSSSPQGTCCTYFRWFMIARLEEYTLLQLTLKNGKFLTPDKNISNASRKGKYFKHGLFDIQCFFLRYLMSDRVWWFLLSPSNQFCHHKSFSMFFLRQLSLGKRINSKSKMEEKERERCLKCLMFCLMAVKLNMKRISTS